MSTLPLFPEEGPTAVEARATIWSVTELTREIREVLEGGVGEVWVEGEIANHRRQASGHQYFTLKDARAQLPCVWFQNARSGLRQVVLSDGMLVRARGRVTVYEARGQYQLNVQTVEAAGTGALAAKFELLKRRLMAEGLFAVERKRELPRFPQRIGVITSPTGAALRDMLNVLERRAPWIEIVIAPVRVQGTGAAREIVAALAELNASATHGLAAPDLIVLARGGGSLEDLWEFNDEKLARAIFESTLPVVSAVGHEVDFTIADFVADLRAPTPSAAAELIAPDGVALVAYLEALRTRGTRCVSAALGRAQREVAGWARALAGGQVRRRIESGQQQLDDLQAALMGAAERRVGMNRGRLEKAVAVVRAHRPDRVLESKRRDVREWARRFREAGRRGLVPFRMRLQQAAQRLRLLGPQQTLERGYSITTDAAGRLLTDAAHVVAGDEIVTLLAQAKLRSVVSGTELAKRTKRKKN